MELRRDVFQAIADPTRRQIIEMLAASDMNMRSVADHFDMSRQAVALHMKVLEACGMLTITRSGREKHCTIIPAKLSEVHAWTEQFRSFWTAKLASLRQLVENGATELPAATVPQPGLHKKRKK
ncbi:transcriptional regulator [Pedobacter yulinensis]|uniref:Transcriptional regulator n=1 Tax=Pedobacter yulinensis TaxID=2126353 RepID=A0A2T3HPG3_9SPHI|nr:metalloregulator ArsR/SmtB family transcription factor [Pedobacter yulinensis]PST84334.1 transcriptional regulator [Pedobacter yulinensis]